MSLPIAIFWITAVLIGYATVGYPITILLLARLRPRPIVKREFVTTVTCVIAARNEARTIGCKIANLLSLDYPESFLDVVVVSDASSDDTDAIVAAWTDRAPGRVHLVALAEPRGKAAALNAGVEAARGDIVVFADARQTFDRRAVRELLQSFVDPDVGAVSGRLLLAASGSRTRGLTSYWTLETSIRKWESDSGSVMGCTGAIYAARRTLIARLPDGALLDDVLVPLRIALLGYRVVFEERAVAVDDVSPSLGHEFLRKMRTVAGNLEVVRLYPTIFDPRRAAIGWRFLSHKILARVLMPYLLLLFLASAAFAPGSVYRAAFGLQVALYGLGVAALALGIDRGVLRYPATFLVLNAASVAGAGCYLVGIKQWLWRSAGVRSSSAAQMRSRRPFAS